MARSVPTRRSNRSTRYTYLRARSAYFLRTASRVSSPSTALAIDPAVSLQRRQLGRESRHPGGVLEADHGPEHGTLVDDGNGGDGSPPFGAVGELIGNLLGAQRRVLRHGLAHLLQGSTAERGDVERPEVLADSLVLGDAEKALRGEVPELHLARPIEDHHRHAQRADGDPLHERQLVHLLRAMGQLA